MRIEQGGLDLGNPAWPLLQAQISYQGITSANGAATGLTFVCADLVNEPSYVGLQVKMISGLAAGQVRTILIDAAGTITVDDAFTDNTGVATTIIARTRFVILSQSAGGGGPIPPTGPSQGLSFMGDVTNAISNVSFASTDLAGFGNFSFVNTYMIYVFRDAAGAAPQGEYRLVTGYVAATGTFTHEAFSANLAVGDKVLIIHVSILFPNIVASGALSASSVTQPADATRVEANQWFRGCTLMILSGPAAFQTRAITYYTAAGGIFTLDIANPLTVLPVIGSRYLILGGSFPTVATIDSTTSLTPGDIIGHKSDTAVYIPDNVSSVMRYLKGLIALNPALLFDLVNAIFTLKETGGTINTAGAGLYDVYRNETPMGVFKPKKVLIDTTLNGAGETIQVSVSYRIVSGGAYVLKDQVSFVGVQALPLKNIELEPNRFGTLVTLQRLAGVARDYPYEVFWED